MELSQKWNTLDTNTQRYIATIAAGSRQQSRFIAMMSDYNRTQDLVTAANNSAGASNEQFQKTMDSLQSKLEKLKNAWDTFTMGIMDSDILKVSVDILTKILETINKITEAFGPLSGAAKIGVLVAGLYAGDNALKVF
jgi:TP901 family phage tail tape measure protein